MEGWDGGEVAVDGEPKRSADGGNAADDIGTINDRCVPGVHGNVDCFDAHFGVTKTLFGGDGQGFVDLPEETFD